MRNKEKMKKAYDYLIKNYKGMKDILSHDDRRIPTIIWYLYRFKKLEDYGYSLEDVFMHVYESIIIKDHKGEPIQNLSSFIQNKIISYFASETRYVTRDKSVNSPGSIEDKLKDLSFRKVEDYDFNEDIDYSASAFVDDIIDRKFVKQLLDKSKLTYRERYMLDKYYIAQMSMGEIGKSYIFSLTGNRVSQILNKSMRKMRGACEYYLHYSPDKE